jgi:hypothetical protein
MNANRGGRACGDGGTPVVGRATRWLLGLVLRVFLVTDLVWCGFQVWGVASTGKGPLALWVGLFLALLVILWLEVRFGFGKRGSRPSG